MRVFAIVLVAFMMLPLGAFAESPESIDYAGLSMEELMTLYESVRNEILLRTGVSDDNTLGRGTYIVGKTIRPGTYRFICTESGVFSETGYVNNLIRVDSEDGSEIFRAKKISVGGHVTFTLSEGDTLEIAGCSGTIHVIVAPIWAPQ